MFIVFFVDSSSQTKSSTDKLTKTLYQNITPLESQCIHCSIYSLLLDEIAKYSFGRLPALLRSEPVIPFRNCLLFERWISWMEKFCVMVNFNSNHQSSYKIQRNAI